MSISSNNAPYGINSNQVHISSQRYHAEGKSYLLAKRDLMNDDQYYSIDELN